MRVTIELLPLCLCHIAIALGGEGDRQWVKDFGASNKSQAVYELAAWLDSLGLKLTVDVQYTEKFMEDFREAQQDLWSFALGLFSGFAFAVEVPIGGEDLQGLEVL